MSAIAITSTLDIIMRAPMAPSTVRGSAKGVIDAAALMDEFDQISAVLETLGARVLRMPADTVFPAGFAIGGAAFATEYLGLVANPAPTSPRQGEQQAAAFMLAPTKFMKFISPPGTLDACDIVRIGQSVFIGESRGTNHDGAQQAALHLKEAGFNPSIVNPRRSTDEPLCASLCDLGNNKILIRSDLGRQYAFMQFDQIAVDESESAAAAALCIGNSVLLPTPAPRTAEALAMHGYHAVTVPFKHFAALGATLRDIAMIVPATTTSGGVMRIDTPAARFAA